MGKIKLYTAFPQMGRGFLGKSESGRIWLFWGLTPLRNCCIIRYTRYGTGIYQKRERQMFDYEAAEAEVNQKLSTTNNRGDDTIFIDDKPFAVAGTGEGFRRLLRDEIVYAMEDFNLSVADAIEKVTAEMQSYNEDQLAGLRSNSWFRHFV